MWNSVTFLGQKMSIVNSVVMHEAQLTRCRFQTKPLCVSISAWGHLCEITNRANTYWNDTISTEKICRTMVALCDRIFNRLKAKCGCIRVEAFVAWLKNNSLSFVWVEIVKNVIILGAWLLKHKHAHLFSHTNIYWVVWVTCLCLQWKLCAQPK